MRTRYSLGTGHFTTEAVSEDTRIVIYGWACLRKPKFVHVVSLTSRGTSELRQIWTRGVISTAWNVRITPNLDTFANLRNLEKLTLIVNHSSVRYANFNWQVQLGGFG